MPIVLIKNTVKAKSGYANQISDGNNISFSSIYDLAGYDSIPGGIPIKKNEYGLKITNLNKNNGVYFNNQYSESITPDIKGILSDPNRSGPATISDWNSGKLSVLKSLNPSGNKSGHFVLPNCVGYAISRVNEIWKLAIDNKLIEKDNEIYKINGREIKGSIQIPNTGNTYGTTKITNTDAKSMPDKWPENIEGWGISETPIVGSLVVWNSGKCGHIAFVESVLNLGTKDEAIIISESGYDKYHMFDDSIINVKKINKGTKNYYNGGSCLGFLISPICQIPSEISYISPFNTGKSCPNTVIQTIINLRGVNDPSQNVEKNPKTDDVVKIKFLGYKDKNSNEKQINKVNSIGRIVSYDGSAKYPYGVSFDGSRKPELFYNRAGFEIK